MASLSGSASAEIDAPIDAVWAIVEDVGGWPAWQDKLGKLDVLERDPGGRASVCRMELDAGITTIKLTLDCSYDPPARMSFERVSGDLKALAGAWRLDDLGEGRTRATYELEVNPGGVLNMVLNDERKAKLRAILIDVRPSELKARAENAA